MTTVIGPRPPSEQDEPADEPALPELEDPHWMHRATELAHTSFWSVARRLPALVREAVVLRRNSDLGHVCGSVPAEPGHGGWRAW
ncbi:hypothetical protein [Micromonospora fulviviridis]|uniref:Uncharacterized protein n=1 Tax=Micromonospora fulviviridis TaxID=47860 RepID=A0ABV2VRH9_9ACTN